MITGGRTQARDEVFALVKVVADTNPTIPTIWQDELEDQDVDQPLFATSMYHTDGQQAAINQGLGQTRWESRGLVRVLIRAPIKQGGLTLVDNLTTLMENAFRGKATPNGVWFRDVVGREVPPKDGNAQAEVSAEFVYQEMG